MSEDSGETWENFSDGLQEQAHCRDLCFVEHKDGSRYLYLGTWGWSLWRANLVDARGFESAGGGGLGGGPRTGIPPNTKWKVGKTPPGPINKKITIVIFVVGKIPYQENSYPAEFN